MGLVEAMCVECYLPEQEVVDAHLLRYQVPHLIQDQSPTCKGNPC